MQYFQGYCIFFFKQATLIIPFFKGTELICKSSYSCSFDELSFFYYKRVITAAHSFKLIVLLYQEDIINTNTSLISGMHILKKVCYMTTSFPGIRFFYDNFIISRQHLKRFISQRDCVYFTALVTIMHYNKRSVGL